MTTDIVERLRGTPLWRHSTPPSRELEESDLGLEAADEIEMLWNAVAEKNAEIERLRAEINREPAA